MFQAVACASAVVVNNSLLLIGGASKDESYRNSTQQVRHGQQAIQWPGPDMSEERVHHCSTLLEDGSIIVTGGKTLQNKKGSNMTEVYNSTTHKWERKADTNQGRYGHACASVWLNPEPELGKGILAYTVTANSILSQVIAGGKKISYSMYN